MLQFAEFMYQLTFGHGATQDLNHCIFGYKNDHYNAQFTLFYFLFYDLNRNLDD